MNQSNILKLSSNIELKLLIKRIKKWLYLGFKRFFDIIIALIGLIISSPIFIIVSILIKREDQGSIFLIQERIGQNGEIFKLYKFRSMVENADEILMEMLKNSKIKKAYKKNMKLSNDPRITKIGKFIRKTSIDELPQLFNVLLGHMSLIGNRPYLTREKNDMGIHYYDIVKTKPGITGYWQISGRSKLSFEERCKLESYYSNNQNLLLDIKIFFKTFYVVLSNRGAE